MSTTIQWAERVQKLKQAGYSWKRYRDAKGEVRFLVYSDRGPIPSPEVKNMSNEQFNREFIGCGV